jgi:hypothetical protein
VTSETGNSRRRESGPDAADPVPEPTQAKIAALRCPSGFVSS